MERDIPGQTATADAAGLPLAGVRVLVTRRPDRSTSLSRALRAAGADVSFLPLVDFERAVDDGAMSRAVRSLAAGRFAWLVVTSATTVDALAGTAEYAGTTLAAAVPARTRVAAVGAGTAAALKRAGVPVALVPAQQSAAGLLAEWPGELDHAAELLLPQADIAAGTLQEGLPDRGYRVHNVVAYRTVPYPAEPRWALYPPVATGEGLLTPAATLTELKAGRIGAVVAASPSQVRRLLELHLPLQHTALVVIGQATGAEANKHGLPVAATAAEPRPAGVTAAVEQAVRRGMPVPLQGGRPEHDVEL